MKTDRARPKLAILDDWEAQRQRSPHTAALQARYDVTISDRPIPTDALAVTLAPFSHLVLNRERTALDAALLGSMPRLRVVANTCTGVPHLDRAALDVLHPCRSGPSPGQSATNLRNS
ncbi:MAG: hypothetical protein NVSMB5_19090 [Candidatus Velthaea sp.]